jgi:hypothetical protein
MKRPAFAPTRPSVPGTPKEAIKRLFSQKGGIKNVEVLLGLKHTVVYAYASEGETDEIRFAQVAALTDPMGTAAAEYLAARAGGVFLPMPQSEEAIGKLTAESVRRHGRAVAEIVDALADQELSQAEAARALPDVEAALSALAQLHSSVAAIARKRTGKS